MAIVGAKGEEPLGQAIADQIKTRTVVCSGQTTVRELMALVKRCQLFLTNDTGPMHVAAAFKVPLIAVLADRLADHLALRCRRSISQAASAGHLLSVEGMSHRPSVQYDRRDSEQVYAAASRHSAACRPAPSRAGAHAGRRPSPISLAGVTAALDRDGTFNIDTGYLKSPTSHRVARSRRRLGQTHAGRGAVDRGDQSTDCRGYFYPRIWRPSITSCDWSWRKTA
ncbi:MAG: hypothetical protein MRJ92_12505 [Nitrospira sp.]|nr:hypothetical protein [Nitrospira sp.]